MKSTAELLPLPIAAAQAGISYDIAWRAVASGKVAVERRGGRVYVDPKLLRALK